MKNIALIKNNECVNVVVVESIEKAIELFGNEFEIIDTDILLNQDYENQKISKGMTRNIDGSWFDPTYNPEL